MAIDVVGEVTAEELRQAERLHRRPGPVFLVVTLLAILVLCVWAADSGPRTVSRTVSVAALGFLALFAVYRLVDPTSLVDREREERPLAASFSEVGMLSKQGQEMRRIAWSQFRNWRSNEHLFVLRNRDSTYEVIPRRVLGQVESHHLETLLRSRLRRAA